MKTTAILTRIIPTISGVRDGGAFNIVIAGLAAPLAEDLRQAANDDRIDVAELLDAIQDLGKATEFEGQQQAMNDIISAADTLLGHIAAGVAPRAESIAYTVGDLIKRIETDVLSIRDVFKPGKDVLRRIRADASELSSLIDAEIISKARPSDHAGHAAMIFDNADRLEEVDHGGREQAGDAIIRKIALLAA